MVAGGSCASVASWDNPISPPASAMASRIANARASDCTPPGDWGSDEPLVAMRVLRGPAGLSISCPHNDIRIPYHGNPGRPVHRHAIDPDARHIAGDTQGERPRQRVLRPIRVAQPNVQRAAGRRPQPERVELLADAELAHLAAEAERRCSGGRGQVEQMRRCQRDAVAVAQLLHEIRLQPLLEQRIAGAGADIAPERHSHPMGEVPVQREQPAAEGRVARRTVRDRGSAGGQALQLCVGGVDVVRQHAPWPDQAMLLVAVDVVAPKQLAHGGDLGRVLVDVRGEPAAGDRRVERRARGEQIVGARQCEARGDGVAAAPVPVPAVGERQPLVVGALRRGVQLRTQQPVAHHQPARDPQAACRCGRRTARRRPARNGRRTRAPWSCRHRRARTRTPPRPPAHSRGRPCAPPRAARSGPAIRAAACRGRR